MRRALTDFLGRTVRRLRLLGEEAAASVGGVRRVTPDHDFAGLDPGRLGQVLRQAETPGYGASREFLELAERMEERYMHYNGLLGQRKRQVSQIPVAVMPASDSQRDLDIADEMQRFFDRPEATEDIIGMLDAIGKGFSVAEILWDMSESQWAPMRTVWRDPRWFDFDRDTGMQAVLRSADGTQYRELSPYKFVVQHAPSKAGLPLRGGLSRIVSWGWLAQNYSLREWLRFAQGYGSPIRLGRYGPEAKKDDMKALWRALRSVSSDVAAMLPEGMEIEFIADTTVRGRAEIFENLVRYIDSRVSIVTIGQTLTSEQGQSGSYSLGQVHNEVRKDVEAYDCARLAISLTRDLVIPYVNLNHGPQKAYPKVVISQEDQVSLELFGATLERLVPLGFRVKTDEVYSRLQLSRPGDGDEVLVPRAPSLPPALPPAGADAASALAALLPGPASGGSALPARAGPQALADLSPAQGQALLDAAQRAQAAGWGPALAQLLAPALAAQGEAAGDAIDQAAEDAAADWQPVMQPLIDPIEAAARRIAAEGGGFAELRAALPGLFARMDDAALTQMLARLAFAARLAGAADAAAETRAA